MARNTGLAQQAQSEEEFQELLFSLQDRIAVTGSRDNIYLISFQDQSRATAVAVVEELVATFVDRSLNSEKAETADAQEFLKTQIAEYERRLTIAEDRLADFKRENVAVMPDQRGDYFAGCRLREWSWNPSNQAGDRPATPRRTFATARRRGAGIRHYGH